MEHEFKINGEIQRIECDVSKSQIKALVNGEECVFDYLRLSENCLHITGKGGNLLVYFAQAKGKTHIFINGEKYIVEDSAADSHFASGAGGMVADKGLVTSPMPGTIIKFLVSEGDMVEVDQGLVIVEAMKMENEIRSTIKAKVKKINFQPGDAVDVGMSIIDLEELEE